RRDGFKIHCPKGRVGSSPTPGTITSALVHLHPHSYIRTRLRRCGPLAVRSPLRPSGACGEVATLPRADSAYAALVKRSMIERKLRENGDALKRAREEVRISTEQLEHLSGEADEARIRAMVSETPLAEQSFHEASRHAEKMRKHHTEVQDRIVLLETRQNELLDQMGAA
ncbi:MAG: hypothetical protein ACI81L_000841, partial [Verrucomicrobiales bacterium]